MPRLYSKVVLQPVGERHETPAANLVDAAAAVRQRLDQSCGLQQFEVLYHGAAPDRQALRELAGRHGRARQTLKNDHPQRVSEQPE